MTKLEVVDLLKAKVKESSQREFAMSIGISPTHLSEVLHGRRNPGRAILRALNIEKCYFQQ